MKNVDLVAGLVAIVATPALAQDMPGAIDLGAQARTQVQSSMADGYAERGGGRMTPGPNGVMISARARAYCQDYPNVRSRHGADDARVKKLAAACRRAGYPY